MAASFGPQTDPGLFVGTTNVWDPSLIQDIDVNSQQFKELLVRLYQNINIISIALNLKESGYYPLTEFLTGNQFFPNPDLTSRSPQTPLFRGSFKKAYYPGALPNNDTLVIPHDLDFQQTWTFFRIEGSSTNQTGLEAVPLPYPSTVPTNTIEMWVDANNINIRTTADYSAYTATLLVLEYLKQ